MNRRKRVWNHVTNIILPSVVFSGVAGAVTGALIFAFRVISEHVIEVSREIFLFANQNPAYIPLVVAGAVLVALVVSLCLSYSPHSRGGGIPTAVALMRGLITFHWLRNIIFVFTSALLSYLCGIPLGNDEGPAVQIGTAVGSGTTRVLGRKHHLAWERYVMTGGATAGFAVATGAPMAAVLFGLEEGHRRFSPLLLISSLTSVLAGMGTLKVLCYFADFESALFHFEVVEVLPLSLTWVAIPIALLCGGFAYVFAKTTRLVRTVMHRIAKNVHPFFKVAPVFALVALVGCFSYACIGTGHSLIEALLEHRVVWYLALALLLARSVLVILSNDVGATGGLFTPLLVCGALIGSITAEVMILTNVLESQYFMLLVVIGMASFFSASVRTPLTAAVFSVEVLSGFHNVLPILLAVLISYIIVETIGVTSINEIAMEREVHKQHKGRTHRAFDVHVTVLPGTFAVGKEPRDILWPPFCHVLSVRKGNDEKDSYEGGALREGDILRLNFTTYDAARTAEELCAILGEQEIYGKK
ncbi:MAG: chloride channel protein [Clostridia bacterium]|nr:chloride channel protein [Clostridia bacterium]